MNSALAIEVGEVPLWGWFSATAAREDRRRVVQYETPEGELVLVTEVTTSPDRSACLSARSRPDLQPVGLVAKCRSARPLVGSILRD